MKPDSYNDSEYTALREELITRIEMRQNIVSLVITTAGVLLGFGISTPALALLFPPLSLFMCIMWAQNDVRALQITDYLHTLESERTKLGWTTFYRSTQRQGSILPGLPFSVMAPGGIFVLTSLMALGIGVSVWPTSRPHTWLSVCDVASVLLMVWLILFVRRARLRRRAGQK
jgi:hypothetical protein